MSDRINELEKELLALKEMNEKSCYVNMKTEQEKKWFKILNPPCYIKEKDDDFEYMGLPATIHNFRHIRTKIIEGKKIKNVGFFDLWQIDPSIRLYETVAFKPPPLKLKEGEYNGFRGFNKLKGKLIPIPEFHELLAALCNFDPKCIEYLKAYLADIVQYPGLQNRSHGRCIIFRGEQGGGKGTLSQILSLILGEKHVKNTSDMGSVLKSSKDKFACAAINKLVVALEETTAADGFSKADLLKDIITSSKINQEIKNVTGEHEHINLVRFLVFTNHAFSIKIEPSDRRYIVFRTSDKYIGEPGKEFFNKLIYKIKNDEDFIYSIYEYLKNLDIEKFDFSERPLTKAYERCRSFTTPHTIRFLADLAITEQIKQTRYGSDELYDKYIMFIKDNGFRSEAPKPKFKGELDELVEDGKVDPEKPTGLYKIKSNSMKYFINKEQFKKYCERKRYNNLFEDDVDENENQDSNKKNSGEIKQENDTTEIKQENKKKYDDLSSIVDDNESLQKEIRELKRRLQAAEQSLLIPNKNKKQEEEIEKLRKENQQLKQQLKAQANVLNDIPLPEVQLTKQFNNIKLLDDEDNDIELLLPYHKKGHFIKPLIVKFHMIQQFQQEIEKLHKNNKIKNFKFTDHQIDINNIFDR